MWRIKDVELKKKDNELASISKKMTRVNKQIGLLRKQLTTSYQETEITNMENEIRNLKKKIKQKQEERDELKRTKKIEEDHKKEVTMEAEYKDKIQVLDGALLNDKTELKLLKKKVEELNKDLLERHDTVVMKE